MKALLWFSITLLVGLVLVWLGIRRLGGLARRQRLTLAALRSLFVLIAALAAAGPVCLKKTVRVGPAPVLVAIDDSASMALPDSSGGLPRAEAVRRALLADGALLDRLAARRPVEVYRFGELCLPLAARRLSASERLTDFHCLLRQLRAEAQRSGAAAIVVVSDGVDTVGLRAAEAEVIARGLPPIYAVTVGGQSELPNLSVEAVECPVRVKAGERVAVRCYVGCSKVPDGGAKVRWSTTAGASGVAAVTFRDRGRGVVEFSFVPGRPGRHRLEAWLRPGRPRENLLAADDAVAVAFDVVPAERRVVYLAGSPSPEFAALRRLLERIEGVKVAVAVKKGRADGWWLEVPQLKKLASVVDVPGFDAALVYIVGDVAAADLPAGAWEKIARRVAAGEAALTVLGGARAAKLPEAVQRLLPARIGALEGRAVHVRGLEGVDLGMRGDLWGGLPALAGVNALGPLARGAKVVMRGTSGEVLVAVREDGEVRSAIVATDSTFRWLLSAAATDASRTAHRELWVRLLAWLLRPRPPRGLTLLPDKLTALRGEQIIVEAWTGAGVGQVRAEVVRGDKTVAQVKFTRRAAGLFSGEIGGLRPGQYVVRARAFEKRRAVAADEVRVLVADQPREWRWPRPERDLLEAVATATGGRLVEWDQVQGLADMLTQSQQRQEVTRRLDLARGLGAGLLALALLFADWFLRRRWGLV